jgi:hypothetical protein
MKNNAGLLGELLSIRAGFGANSKAQHPVAGGQRDGLMAASVERLITLSFFPQSSRS